MRRLSAFVLTDICGLWLRFGCARVLIMLLMEERETESLTVDRVGSRNERDDKEGKREREREKDRKLEEVE